ncbi:MAG: polysaccharide pyruvyl transferase family protein [Lachnospiraceae bacterium]|nr:polysaccharide pyruvyl transferase family protein [Lachnospiraceae bacterium]
MRKILIRAWVNPLEPLDPAKVTGNNMIGNNAGNLMFAHSIMRTLLCDDMTVDTIMTYREFSDREVDYYNSEYECFIIPLANAFRISFQQELIYLRHLVDRLTIPCVVIGVGMQGKVDVDVKQHFQFDDEVVKFVKSILGKSAILGVRGEITAAYLKKLGFAEERDFTVIGCPAMYMNGDELAVKALVELQRSSKVSVNRKPGISAKMHNFIVKSSKEFDDYMYIPQGIEDLALLYAGRPFQKKKHPKLHATYPGDVQNEIYAGGHEIGFVNVVSWLEFLKTRDFSFGTRIHGNIAAIVAGVPAFVFAPDARILELAQYHNIQYMLTKDVKDTTNIFDVYEKADFNRVKDGHVKRFHHYLDFLETNGLQHVYGKERVNIETPFDRALREKEFCKGIEPITLATSKEQIARKSKYYCQLVAGKCARVVDESRRKSIRVGEE